jgi:hypothetical protein
MVKSWLTHRICPIQDTISASWRREVPDRVAARATPTRRLCYLQPQLVELAVPQHDAFSDGAQHDACLLGEQQAEPPLVAGLVACSRLSVLIVNLPYVSSVGKGERSQGETVDRRKRRT